MNFDGDYVPGPGTVLIWLSYDDNIDLLHVLISLTAPVMKSLRWSVEDRKRLASHFVEATSEFGVGKSQEELDSVRVPITLPVEDAVALRDFLSRTIGHPSFRQQAARLVEVVVRVHDTLAGALQSS